jgi:hypothetical protein
MKMTQNAVKKLHIKSLIVLKKIALSHRYFVSNKQLNQRGVEFINDKK